MRIKLFSFSLINPLAATPLAAFQMNQSVGGGKLRHAEHGEQAAEIDGIKCDKGNQ